jgi:hypothetical protein
MSSSRPKLKFDEQSFQDMLSAAFTIQEHNAKRKRALQPEHVCGQCGAPVKDGELLCWQCAGEQLRPGEQMQRKWASLWLMSQEQGLWQERSAEERSEPETKSELQIEFQPQLVPQEETITAEIRALRFPDVLEIPEPADQPDDLVDTQVDPEWSETALANLSPAARTPLAVPEVEFDPPETSLETNDEMAAAAPWNIGELRLKLRFHRADVYLVVAIVVSTFAMIWVLSATPASGAARKPRLRPWERALVSMGLAEAPELTPPRRGNPNIQVWVDPKTALYYCVGEEGYGKTAGGHVATQREAQLDQFEPASRAACD